MTEAFQGADFKSKENYRKATAYVKIHNIKTTHPSSVKIRGRTHKILHNDLPHVFFIAVIVVIGAFVAWRFMPKASVPAGGAQPNGSSATLNFMAQTGLTAAQTLTAPPVSNEQTLQALVNDGLSSQYTKMVNALAYYVPNTPANQDIYASVLQKASYAGAAKAV